jgi:hypothetical protein
MRLVINFHTLLLFATILALQPKILLIIEGTEETNFVFARESPCFNEYHHLIVCILKRRVTCLTYNPSFLPIYSFVTGAA